MKTPKGHSLCATCETFFPTVWLSNGSGACRANGFDFCSRKCRKIHEGCKVVQSKLLVRKVVPLAYERPRSRSVFVQILGNIQAAQVTD